MRTCLKTINYVQVINAEGDVRVCGWNHNNIIGNLLEQDMPEIMHGKKADELRSAIAAGDYSNCPAENCIYQANNRIGDILADIDEIPDYPPELHLAYEGVCNYNCTCCTSHQHMEDTRRCDYSGKYELLEKKLKEILPHVKKIGANGRGELFASKRILKLLQEWRPLADEKEVSVDLETNGSLFDERHWKQIENLGRYHLKVIITVMSFQEEIYRHLSGTELPIKRIEENLRFVKGLREAGVINELTLATVLQEENFREMPEFTRRCIEEFGADIVRIRPIFPGGIYDENIQWFMDVRNPEHPYYEQYKKVMEDPVFRHPKVLLWSGNLPSTKGEHPGIKLKAVKKMEAEAAARKTEAVREAVDSILAQPDFMEYLRQNTGGGYLHLYGIGTLGKLLAELDREKKLIRGLYDKYSALEEWRGIPVMKPGQVGGKTGVIVSTVYEGFEEIRKELHQNGFAGEIRDLFAIIKERDVCGKL